MRITSSTPHTTVIIQPGSRHLRIGLAVDLTPRVLPQCIARRRKNVTTSPTDPVLHGSKLNPACLELPQPSVAVIQNLFNLPKSLQLSANCDDMQWEPVEKRPGLFEMEKRKYDSHQKYFVFDEALRLNGSHEYNLRWPIRAGFFNPDQNYSAVIQDLEDIWAHALEIYFGLPRSTLPNCSVILLIGDVYRRSEVRHMADLLLQRLQFGQLLVHQTAVCATYAVGLLGPTSPLIVVDVGEEKTSVCCVDEGVTQPETRIVLTVGRSNVLRTFHTLATPKGVSGDDSDLDYCSHSDVETLQMWFSSAERAASSFLASHANTLPCPMSLHSQETDHAHEGVVTQCTTSIQWHRIGKQCLTLPVSLHTVLYASILPFSQLALTAIPLKDTEVGSDDARFYVLQTPSSQATQPDDPFDDVHMHMTARERRKRNPIPITTTTPAVTTLTEETSTDANEAREPTEVKPDQSEVKETPVDVQPDPLEAKLPQAVEPTIHRPKAPVINSLPSAIWWSATQCAHVFHNPPDSTSVASPAALDETRRRCLSTILLTGAGCSGSLAGSVLSRWLTHELMALLQSSKSDNDITRPPSTTIGNESTGRLIEVIHLDDQPHLAWSGARLLLATDVCGDLWISSEEWKKFGSRALREKAPFIW